MFPGVKETPLDRNDTGSGGSVAALGSAPMTELETSPE